MYIKLIIGTGLGLCNIYKGNISKRRVCILVILTIVYILMFYVYVSNCFYIIFNFQVKNNDEYNLYLF